MSYREKVAWLSLLAMAVTFGPYFTSVAAGVFRPEALPNLRQLGVFGAAAIVQMLILGIGHFYLRRRSPDDAGAPPDERDLAIMRRSMTLAYYVLIAGMILVGCVMPFRTGGWTIVNAALFMIITAELVHYAAVVVSYRRHA
jgi:hypothetical protein